jgi:hypothetical protein
MTEPLIHRFAPCELKCVIMTHLFTLNDYQKPAALHSLRWAIAGRPYTSMRRYCFAAELG